MGHAKRAACRLVRLCGGHAGSIKESNRDTENGNFGGIPRDNAQIFRGALSSPTETGQISERSPYVQRPRGDNHGARSRERRRCSTTSARLLRTDRAQGEAVDARLCCTRGHSRKAAARIAVGTRTWRVRLTVSVPGALGDYRERGERTRPRSSPCRHGSATILQ